MTFSNVVIKHLREEGSIRRKKHLFQLIAEESSTAWQRSQGGVGGPSLCCFYWLMNKETALGLKQSYRGTELGGEN